MLHAVKDSQSAGKLAARLTETLQAPSVITLVSDVHTPVSAFHKLSRHCPTAFLFESADGDTRLARYSFVGVDPLFTVVLDEGKARILAGTGADGIPADGRMHTTETGETCDFADPTAFLNGIMEPLLKLALTEPQLSRLPFTGGLVGYLGYAATRYFEKIQPQTADPLAVPDAIFGLYDSIVVFDHQSRLLHIISRRGEAFAGNILERLQAKVELPPLPGTGLPDGAAIFSGCRSNIDKETFLHLVESCREYIMEGQVFQIVLSQRFSLPLQAEALAVYRLLQSINPSPYAYFLKLPGFEYLGSSPETFIACRDGSVTLRAIAGTRPRGSSDDADARLAEELKSNEKELAEHHMLVDLARNDLGRICAVGSIEVGEIATLTRYAHVMHLSTEVRGRLHKGKTSFDALRSCFPRGTVSGAPKIRAMQLLSTLEPDQRGIYSGFVGYFDFSGNMDGAIAIRSALCKDGAAHISAGAGIVLDSRQQDEYEETRNKAKSIVQAAVAANAARGFAS